MGRAVRRLAGAAAVVFAASLGGCAYLPSSAPTPLAVERAPDGVEPIYYFVKVTPEALSLMSTYTEATFPTSFRIGDSYKPSIAIRPGDVLGVTVFETGGASIFAPLNTPSVAPPATAGGAATPAAADTMQSKTTTLPPLTVESDGTVVIPFSGSMRVAGLTPSEAANAIAARLSTQTLKPQVLVTLSSSVGNTAAVGGDANRPGLVPLSLRGERLLDVLAVAGGSRWPAQDTDVRIIRGMSSGTVRLSRVTDDPRENIRIRPNDQVFLIHNPKTFTVMGATQKVSQYTFDIANVSLAEAVARSGGPIDTIGTPSAIYLFREEPKKLVRQFWDAGLLLGPDGQAIDPTVVQPPSGFEAMSRLNVLYKVNMAEAQGYFIGKKLAMRDRDVVLVPDAVGTELLKMLTVARGVSGIASDLNISPTASASRSLR